MSISFDIDERVAWNGNCDFLWLGNHTHSFCQEDHHALSGYRSTCTTAKHFEQPLKTIRTLRCEDHLVIKSEKPELKEEARITKEQGTEIGDRFPKHSRRLSDQA
ncbi:MAG TPA: hypothetical protein DIW81_00020 [Planctomycetaceae bacterium]|nr:hypothetical protein [Rubinisphaera sp.]HCS49974.1 hypothetical protein [Planctomycetaceae bacterium]